MKQLTVWEVVKLFCLAFVVMYSTMYFTKDRKDFNASERIFVGGLAELIKALVCFIIAYWKESGYKKTEYMPEYIFCGLLSSFQSFSWVHSGQTFPTFILQIFNHSKIFFVYVMASVFLKRRYTILQTFSQILLVSGILIPLISELMLSKTTTLLDQSCIDYFILLCLPISSAISGIFFEKSIVHKIGSKWKNAVNYSITSAVVSFIGCSVVCMVTDEKLRRQNIGGLAFVSLIKSFDSLLFGYIVIYYTTLVRVFVTIVVSILMSLVMSYQFKEEITVAKGVSMGVTVFSISLFHLPYYFRRLDTVGK